MLRFASAVLASLFVLAASGRLDAEDFTVDTAHSSVIFRVKHLNTSYAYGRFNDITGSFVLDKKSPAKCALNIEVKTASVDTANAQRDTHLKGPDFFNVKQFPTATFKSKSVKLGSAPSTLDVTGDLTINGVTKPVTAKVELTGEGATPFKDYRAGLETTLTLKRSDFGIKFMPEGLGDEVKLVVSLEGVRKP